MKVWPNNEGTPVCRAQRVWFEEELLHVVLTNERVITLPIAKVPWLHWLANATSEERTDWSIEPDGYAVYWNSLDDGFEITHALNELAALPAESYSVVGYNGSLSDEALTMITEDSFLELDRAEARNVHVQPR